MKKLAVATILVALSLLALVLQSRNAGVPTMTPWIESAPAANPVASPVTPVLPGSEASRVSLPGLGESDSAVGAVPTTEGGAEEQSKAEARDAGEVEILFRAVDEQLRPLGPVKTRLLLRLYAGAGTSLTTHEPNDTAADAIETFSESANSYRAGYDSMMLPRRAFPDQRNVIRLSVGKEERVTWIDDVVVPPTGRIELGDVQFLRPRDRFPVPLISGRLISDSGEPLVRARGNVEAPSKRVKFAPRSEGASDVEPGWPRESSGEVVVEEDGRFFVHGPSLPPGGRSGLDLTFGAKGHMDEYLFHVPAGSHSLVVELAQSKTWKGRIIVPEPGPPPGAYAVWTAEKGRAQGVQVRPDGPFQAQGTTRSGRIKVTFSSNGPALWESPVSELEADGPGPVEVDLRPHVEVINLICQMTDGTPWADAQIRIGMVLPPAAGELKSKSKTVTALVVLE